MLRAFHDEAGGMRVVALAQGASGEQRYICPMIFDKSKGGKAAATSSWLDIVGADLISREFQAVIVRRPVSSLCGSLLDDDWEKWRRRGKLFFILPLRDVPVFHFQSFPQAWDVFPFRRHTIVGRQTGHWRLVAERIARKSKMLLRP